MSSPASEQPAQDRLRETALWSIRVLWFLLPLTLVAPAVDLWGDDRTSVTAVAWALWAIGLAATALPLPVTLTLLRVLAPVTVVVVVALLLDGTTSARHLLALVHGIALTVAALTALVGDRFADGASYGDERRMLLRPGATQLFAGAPIAWAATVAGIAVPLVLLVDRRWLVGVVAALIGLAVAAAGFRALHTLARRWIVFVPNGFVLHDLSVLAEPILFRRTAVERLMPAVDQSPARDLSLGAPGLLLECQLTDPAPLGLRSATAASSEFTMTDVRRWLFAPSRPGALLDEAERRRFAVF